MGEDLTRVMTAPDREPRRVRHETRRRVLTVTAVEMLNARMLRLRLHSPELADFVSAGPDDHIKLFLPMPDGSEAKRDYTPRYFDIAAGTLVLDFALHEAGPATAWAKAARPGDTLQIGGPRGSMIVPDTFDWYLLVGDATALPAIGRRVEELRDGVPVTTIGLVDSMDEAQAFDTEADWRGHWVVRDGTDDAELLLAAVDRVFPASGAGFVWIACEAGLMAMVRDHTLERHGHNRQWMKASGYWVRGSAQG